MCVVVFQNSYLYKQYKNIQQKENINMSLFFSLFDFFLGDIVCFPLFSAILLRNVWVVFKMAQKDIKKQLKHITAYTSVVDI